MKQTLLRCIIGIYCCLFSTLSMEAQGFFNNEEAGRSALVSASDSCQTIIAVLDASTPAAVPADTGWIDICPGDLISLSGSGRYPQNDSLYNQSDNTSTFRWDFGDGATALGPNVQHRYTEPGGYWIQLTIEDERGCTNANFIRQRVRVSGKPRFQRGDNWPQNACQGDTLLLQAAFNTNDPGSGNLFVFQNTLSFPSSSIRSDSLPLPDGSGVAYESSVIFSSFDTGQTLGNISDIRGICLNMEHSWMRDLEISLTCPNGQSVVLHDHFGKTGSEVFLGQPVDDDDVLAPGQGYEYCWAANASRPSWLDYANQNQPSVLPEGFYSPAEPLDQLLGCPLNGEWTIKVEDLWEEDNGIVFSWGIDFVDFLFPELERFSPDITTSEWAPHPDIVEQTSSVIRVAPSRSGSNGYTFRVRDEFGCTFDTTLQVNVLPPNRLSCLIGGNQGGISLNDTTICRGDSLELDLNIDTSTQAPVTMEIFPDYAIGMANHPRGNPYASVIAVEDIFPLSLTEADSQIVSVCVDLETDWASDIHLFLQAPNGAMLELSTDNGGGGDNYSPTCFTPTAIDSIVNGSPPFSGDFLPEGDWNILNGTDINGDWVLLISDGFGDSEMGKLVSWSITFSTQNDIDLSWSPDLNISCTDCLDPVFSPDTTTTYTLTLSDNTGEEVQDSFTLSVLPAVLAPQINCGPSGTDQISFFWSPDPDLQYNIKYSINGAGEVELDNYQDSLLVVDGLMENDEVSFEILPVATLNGITCPGIPLLDTCRFAACDLQAELVEFVAPTCPGSANGQVELTASGGEPSYIFQYNGNQVMGGTAVFSNLADGVHLFVVTDQRSCMDTIAADLSAPAPLTVSFLIEEEISCAGSDDGVVLAEVQGGQAPYTFDWKGINANADRIENLAPGTYVVEVTDGAGCSTVDSVSLSAPPPLVVVVDGQMPTCFDRMDGQINAAVSGGAGPYSFEWEDGTTTEVRENLTAGIYELTVQDANGCEQTGEIELINPDPLQVDSIQVIPVDCFGGANGSAIVYPSGGSGNYDYVWDDPLAQVDSIATRLRSGTYRLTLSDENGCSVTDEVFVPEPDPLSLVLNAANIKCKGNTDGRITAVVNGGNVPYSFNWSNNETTETIRNLARGTYRVTVTDARGCQVQGSSLIEEPDTSLQLMAEQIKQGCFGEKDNEAAVTAIGGQEPFEYLWSDGQDTRVALGLDSLAYGIQVTDANGCISTDTIKLQDLEPINPNIIISPPSCRGTSNGALGINFVEGGSNAELEEYTFVWSNGATGDFIDGLIGGEEYEVTVTDPVGCQAVEKRTVTLPTEITYEADVQPVSCFGGNDGRIELSNLQGQGRDFIVRWDVASGGSVLRADQLSAGNYSFTITDEANCTKEARIRITQPPPLLIDFETQDIDCFNKNVGSAMAVVQGGTGNYSYRWSNRDTGSTITNLYAGPYVVTVTDDNGCTAEKSTIIRQPEPFNTSYTTKMPTCAGDRNGAISIEVDGGTPPYQFSRDNKNFQFSNSFLGLFADQYNIFIRDARGCLLFETITLEDPEPLVLQARPQDARINIGDSIQLEGSSANGAGPVELMWKAPYGGTLSCTDCPNPFARPEYTITYELVGVDENGCTGSDFLTVFVDKPKVILVPTGFTPNDDGVNDVLIVHGEDETLIRSFQVFDRWGTLVYEAQNFMANEEAGAWNGHFRNEAAANGVYVWIVEAEFKDGYTEVFKGQTSLIR